jgi:hypothetical protein
LSDSENKPPLPSALEETRKKLASSQGPTRLGAPRKVELVKKREVVGATDPSSIAERAAKRQLVPVGIAGTPPPKSPGRPKQDKAVKAKAKAMCAELLEDLHAIAKDSDARASDRIKAIETIMAYGIGKPTNVVGEDPDMPFHQSDLRKMSQAELEKRLAHMLVESVGN